MQIKPRSYPHPVLSHFGDDILNSVFMPVVKVKGAKNAYVFEAIFKTNNADLLHLIEQKKAQYAVHVECNQTRYRSIFTNSAVNFSFEIPASMLDGRVEVCSFILAARPLDKYKNGDFHPDYAKLSFRVRRGDTLAVGHDHEFPADKKNDPLRKVSSIFSIVKSNDPQAIGMDIDLSGLKIRVTLSEANFNAYMFLRQSQPLHAVLSASIIVPALVDVIEKVRCAAMENATGQFVDRRWYMVLSRKLRDISIDPENPDSFVDSSLKIAQVVLGHPISASLEGLRSMLQEDVE